MNRRQMTAAMVLGGAGMALSQSMAWRPALAGGWASLELLNPLRMAVVDLPVTIDAQVLQHGVTPNPDFGGAIRFTHEGSGAAETLRMAVVSRANAIVRGEHTFAAAGTWRMATFEMGPEVELGTVEVVAPDEGEVISALWSAPELAAACGDVAAGPTVETDILDSAFADPRLEVAAGTTVTWVNTSAVPHQVVFDDAAITGSAMLKQDDRFSVTFTDPGEYAYHCAPHPFMTGVIAVTGA
jgi:amicyanin